MKRFFQALIGSVVGLALVIGVTGCAATPADVSSVTAVIDVRTPAEYAAGHLQGAINVDVEAADFNERIDQLDKAGTYLVYCHSGRRAGIATDDMKSLGFTDVTNIGGLAAAADYTKLPLVQ